MTLVDSFCTAGADKKIFIVIGHTDHFMGNHLSNRQDQIVSALVYQLVQLGGPVIGNGAIGYTGNKSPGTLPKVSTSFLQS